MSPTRADQLFETHRAENVARVSRIFAYLMLAQWVAAIAISLLYSPTAWAGSQQSVHLHVYVAVVLGGLLSSLPVALTLLRPTAASTRYVVSAAQMLWSALFIHLTGGRIETHFHVFGSLAFLAFYRDWKVLLVATVVVAGDHFLRGFFWSESVYGVPNPEWWRFLEHAFWVVFENFILVLYCVQSNREMRVMAERQADVEVLSAAQAEQLAAVANLAASVGHELRNPLAAIRNASSYISKRLATTGATVDARVPQFLGVMEREIDVRTKIISDLLDFAREKAPALAPCPLHGLVEEAIALVPPGHATVVNDVPQDHPVPDLDRHQFRQVLVNLIQNAVEALPADRADGRVVVRAESASDQPWRIVVEDNGNGIPADVAAKIFEPLFTTKTKGTGLGLAIVSNAVKRHGASIRVENATGSGARFVIEFPVAERLAA